MTNYTKFDEEVAELNLLREDAAKLHVRALFRHRQVLESDPRKDDEGKGAFDPDSPAAHWLDDICRNSEALLRVYLDHLATKEWLFEQLTERAPHCLLDVEGEEKMFDELRRWADV